MPGLLLRLDKDVQPLAAGQWEQRTKKTKSPGAILNVACDGPKGGGLDVRSNKHASTLPLCVATIELIHGCINSIYIRFCLSLRYIFAAVCAPKVQCRARVV